MGKGMLLKTEGCWERLVKPREGEGLAKENLKPFGEGGGRTEEAHDGRAGTRGRGEEERSEA